MNNKSELIAFLNEVIELRSLNRSDASRSLPEVIAISEEVTRLFDSIEDETIRAKLYCLEELKNAHSAEVISYMYKAGIWDVVDFFQLLFKTFFRNQE